MAITTIYNGIEYRSRLEARWAAFMQNIGWDIVYEPFDGDGYIPDFLVQGKRPFLIEVKPAVTLKEYEAAVPKAEKGLGQHWNHDVLIVGASPFPMPMGNGGGDIAGWLGQDMLPTTFEIGEVAAQMARATGRMPELDDVLRALEYPEDRRVAFREANWPEEEVREAAQWVFAGEPTVWDWDAAEWFKCRDCGAVSVYHSVQSFSGRPCGCYDGDHHLGQPPMNALRSMWADACNDVKWRGRPA